MFGGPEEAKLLVRKAKIGLDVLASMLKICASINSAQSREDYGEA